jgi:hypothetical protein
MGAVMLRGEVQNQIAAAGRTLEECRQHDRERAERARIVARRYDLGLVHKTYENLPLQSEFMDPSEQTKWDAWLQSHLARQGQDQQEIIADILAAMEDMLAAIRQLQNENGDLRTQIKALPGKQVLISGCTPDLEQKLERLEKRLCAEISRRSAREISREYEGDIPIIRKRRDNAAVE